MVEMTPYTLAKKDCAINFSTNLFVVHTTTLWGLGGSMKTLVTQIARQNLSSFVNLGHTNGLHISTFMAYGIYIIEINYKKKKKELKKEKKRKQKYSS